MNGKMMEDLISTALLTNLTLDATLSVREAINESPTDELSPGMIVVYMDDSGGYQVYDLAIESDDEEEIEEIAKTSLLSFADSKTMVVAILFGATTELETEIDGVHEKHIGFLLRACSIDGRKMQSFFKIYFGKGGSMAVEDNEPVEIMKIEEEDYDDGMMDEFRNVYMTRYSQVKDMAGKQKIN